MGTQPPVAYRRARGTGGARNPPATHFELCCNPFATPKPLTGPRHPPHKPVHPGFSPLSTTFAEREPEKCTRFTNAHNRLAKILQIEDFSPITDTSRAKAAIGAIPSKPSSQGHFRGSATHLQAESGLKTRLRDPQTGSEPTASAHDRKSPSKPRYATLVRTLIRTCEEHDDEHDWRS